MRGATQNIHRLILPFMDIGSTLILLSPEMNQITVSFIDLLARDACYDFLKLYTSNLKIDSQDNNHYLYVELDEYCQKLLDTPISPEQLEEYHQTLKKIYKEKLNEFIFSKFRESPAVLIDYFKKSDFASLIVCNKLLNLPEYDKLKEKELVNYFTIYLAASDNMKILKNKLDKYFDGVISNGLLIIRIEKTNTLIFKTTHPLVEKALIKLFEKIKVLLRNKVDSGKHNKTENFSQFEINLSDEIINVLLKFLEEEQKNSSKTYDDFKSYLIGILQLMITEELNKKNKSMTPHADDIDLLEQLLVAHNTHRAVKNTPAANEGATHTIEIEELSLSDCLEGYRKLLSIISQGKPLPIINGLTLFDANAAASPEPVNHALKF